MSYDSAYDLRTPSADEWPAVSEVMWGAFNDTPDDELDAADRDTWEPERSVVAERDGVIVGHASSFTRGMVVPGSIVPAAHVTMVSVEATHRRRGLLSGMIDRLHRDAADRHEPIAVLWASEGRIYQRFGYGLAARQVHITAQDSEIIWLDARPSVGRVRPVDATSPDSFIDVYEAALPGRPGWSTRDDRWWRYLLTDAPSRRKDATALRAVLHEDDHGKADGYLLWRVKGSWEHTGPNGTVSIKELVTTTPEAYRALWQFALSVDLTRHVQHWSAAVDEPLQYMIGDPRRLDMTIGDSLWVRVIDVAGALEARRYAAPVDLVLDVVDERISSNHGRWHLTGSADKAACVATDEPADLVVDIRALGAAYLGSSTLSALAAAGRVTELRPGALAAATTAFRWTVEPSTTDGF